ncbi:GNAT family N-acetyltransferase [Halobacteriaceae archaeon SHR40]|uniref:GNAT family N-acetyltransferase n=1 Tax=Halovenus amylolytica TaxID=2500550 RepID=UPI000FE3C41E
MNFELLGDGSAGPALSLDHEQFAYAGKFVMSGPKAVAREDDSVVGAISFSEDHSDSSAVRLRYVTVREDRRGEGIGPRLLRFTAVRLTASYDEVLIAANNPIAYEACYRAGFVFTGEETGIAEVLMRYRPDDRETDRYREGFTVFEDRELPAPHEAVCRRHADGESPAVVPEPSGD